MSEWVGKSAIVTGGASGIGAAVARRIVSAGGRVLLADLNTDAGEQLVDELGGPGQARYVRTDVTSQIEVFAAVQTAMAAFGRVDFLHNNAGIMHRHDRIEDVPLDSFRTVLEVNLIGMFLAAQAVVPVMKIGGGGVIINMSSRGGSRGQGHILSYSATKAGILSFTRGLADQLRPHGIRVNALMPSVVDTQMTQGGPNMRHAASAGSYVFTADEIAKAVLELADKGTGSGMIRECVGTPDGPRYYEVGELERREILSSEKVNS